MSDGVTVALDTVSAHDVLAVMQATSGDLAVAAAVKSCEMATSSSCMEAMLLEAGMGMNAVGVYQERLTGDTTVLTESIHSVAEADRQLANGILS